MDLDVDDLEVIPKEKDYSRVPDGDKESWTDEADDEWDNDEFSCYR